MRRLLAGLAALLSLCLGACAPQLAASEIDAPAPYGLGTTRTALTGAYGVTAADQGATLDCTSGTFQVTLGPAATLGSGFHCWVYNSGSGTITIKGNGAELIRVGTTTSNTATLTQGQGYALVCNGTGWSSLATPVAGTAVGGDLTGTLPNPTIAANAVTDAKLRQGGATSVIGRSANSIGNVADIAASADGQYLTRQAGALSFAGIAAGDISSGTLPAGRMPALTGDVTSTAGTTATTFRSGTATSVVGRAANSSGAMADIAAAADGKYLTRQAGVLGFSGLNANDFTGGTVPSAQMPALTGDVTTTAGSTATTIAANAVTNAKFRQGAATSVVGVSGGSTANVADIAASADGQVLQRSGGSLQWLGGSTVRSVTTTATLVGTDSLVKVDGSGSSYTITLPAANAFSGRAQTLSIVRTDTSSNAVALARAGSDTIILNSGAVTAIPLSSGYAMVLVSDGTSKWYMVDRNQPTYPIDILPDPFCQIAMGADLVSGGTSTGYGKLTMWKGLLAGASSGTFTQGSTIGRLGTSAKWTGVTFGSGYVGVQLFIPASDAATLVNKSLTFLMSIRTDDVTSPSWVMNIDKANAADDFSVVTNIAGGTATYGGAAQTVAVYVPNMGACQNGVRIEMKFAPASVTSKTYEFADAMIYSGYVQHDATNAGTVATLGSLNTVDFPVQSHDAYMTRVQAWYEKSFPETTAPANNLGSTTYNYYTGTGIGNGNSYFGNVPFKVRKHVGRTPTITFYNPLSASAGTWNCYNASNVGSNNTMTTTVAASEWGFSVVTATSGLLVAIGAWEADCRF